MSYEREHVGVLRGRLEEPPRTIQIVLGPRQSGKTTIVTQALRSLTTPWRYFDVDSADNDLVSPVLQPMTGPRRSRTAPRDKEWLIDVWGLARADAARHDGSVLALDELQSIPDWSSTVKGLWDGDRLNDRPLHVVILGSAPMAIQSSLKESMTGRFEVISVRHWSFSEMKMAFGLDLDQYIYFGGYPGVVGLANRWPPDWQDYEPRWREYVRTSFVGPAIERDVLAMTRVDKPALLARLFELGAAYSGQILPLHKMLGQLQDAGNATTLARYLDLLSQVGLLNGLPKYTPSMLRLRASPPKFNVLNTALMTVGSNRSFEDARADRRFWGRLVESAVGAHLLNTSGSGARVHYWREGDDEVDFVIQAGLRTVAVEVKTGPRARPTAGMRRFAERYQPYRSLLVTETGEPHGSVPLEVFLSRPATAWFRSEFVQRRCTKITVGTEPDQEGAAKPLSEYDETPAYVLLGDPGLGKTTYFREACRNLGRQAHMISARDFVTLDVAQHPEWRDRTLFIDGLDEIRAGRDDARTPLDDVRRQLDRLGPPSFRLSCREADWLGKNDQEHLNKVAPGGEVTVLRLDSLSEEDVVEVAESRLYLQDGEQFLKTAEDKGLGELVRNPQNLELLAAATRTGKWPESRTELFEFACRHLVSEPNDEHLSARLGRSDDLLLKTAGRLCSLLLLSGTAGIRLSPAATSSPEYRPVDLVDPVPSGASPGDADAWNRQQRAAISSRLFRAAAELTPAERCFVPVHRHIAEFLAGRFLAQQIEDGLPVAWVVALVTVGDGGVVTAHRGLSAWLAAHSRQARRELIQRDPIGVGLYGDIGAFSNEEKQPLLDALVDEGRQLDDIGYRGADVFAPLASQGLETDFRALLTVPAPSEDDQFSVKFVLRVLSRGTPMAALVPPIREILYGAGWRQDVTWAALDALVRQCADPHARIDELKQILTDAQDGSLSDEHNELAATVLEELYPDAIGPSEIWRHLARCQPTSLYGRHRRFWTHSLEEKTPDEDIPTLLDALAAQRPDLALVDSGSGDGRAAAERLLARALAEEGDKLTQQRLHKWLNAPARTDAEFLELRSSHEVSEAASEFFLSAPPPSDDAPEAWESASKVRSWLEAHPDSFKAAFLEGVRRYDDEWDLQNKVALAKEYLRQAQPPSDFGRWCLEQAGKVAETRPELARWLLGETRRRLDQGEEGLSEQLIDEAVRNHPSLRPSRPAPEAASELRERSRSNKAAANTHLERRRRQQQEWLDAVRAEAPALEQNRGAPGLLYRLATKWLQRFHNGQLSLFDWLMGELGDDSYLAAAVGAGLRDVVERQDVPDASEILRLHGENRMHYLSTPFLVSLDERDLSDTRFVDGLNRRQKRQACAFYFTVLISRSAHPNWYRRLLEREVDLVAEVLLSLARAELKRGTENVPCLPELAHDEGHADIARLVCLPLLRGFPVRCHARQLHNLLRLLWTALRHPDPGDLLAVIEKKLAGQSMTVGQRVHWLAAGAIAAPDEYAERLAEFIDGQEIRARHLARFLWSEHPDLFLPAELSLPPRALEVLIRQSGAAFGVSELPDRARIARVPGNGQFNAQPESVLWRIPDLIECLAGSPEPEAGEALRRLADDERLHRWRYQLRQARDRQAVIARDSSYRRPELEAVRATLDHLAPANAADLAALAFDRLNELATTIRHANTNDWSQYWNQDSYGNLTTSKAENDCRNNLLSHLRPLLPNGVDAQPEGQYAANRRADIRLSCSGFHVPVEVKKNSHPALWRAARDQLVAKYTQDPATGGHGIFLVLWFGDGEKSPLDETGTRPSSPEELRQRLEVRLAKQLTPEQARRIAMQVIDVSRA